MSTEETQKTKVAKVTDNILFTPPDGRSKYQDGDFIILCRATPIPYGQLPRYLANPYHFKSIRPPRLWCGWRSGREALYRTVKKHFPNNVVKSAGKDLICDTPFQLPVIVREQLQIPPNLQHLVDIIDAADKEGKFDYAFVIGNNYEGLLTEKDVETLKETIFDGEGPEWFLTNRTWQWVSSRAGRKLDLKSIPKIALGKFARLQEPAAAPAVGRASEGLSL